MNNSQYQGSSGKSGDFLKLIQIDLLEVKRNVLAESNCGRESTIGAATLEAGGKASVENVGFQSDKPTY